MREQAGMRMEGQKGMTKEVRDKDRSRLKARVQQTPCRLPSPFSSAMEHRAGLDSPFSGVGLEYPYQHPEAPGNSLLECCPVPYL